MSLLMDALKKAEEEKKRAAKQLKEVDESDHVEHEAEASGIDESDRGIREQETARPKRSSPDHLELTLAPMDGSEEEVEDDAGISDRHEMIDITGESEASFDKTEEISAEFSEDMTMENTIKQELPDASLEATQEAIDLNDTTIVEGLSVDSNTAAPFDDTFHGVILDDEDDSAYEETLPGVSADQLAKDLGGGIYQPTPVAAKTVFNAGKKNKQGNSFKWGIFSVLVLLALVSFGVFYYFSVTPVARQMPSPDVARGVESTPAPLPALPPVENDEISATLIDSKATEMKELVASTIEAPAMDSEQADASADSEAQDMQTEGQEVNEVTEPESGVEPGQAEIEIATPDETMIDTLPMGDAPVEETAAQETTPEMTATVTERQSEQQPAQGGNAGQLPEYLDADRQALLITKKKELEKSGVFVKQGFQAYSNGNYELAKSLYQDALRLQDDNRDARLGLAAIALKNGDRQVAFMHYNYILQLDPEDSVALTGMQSIYQNRDPVRDESAIKLLLQKEGDSPYLYFALGNSYARQKRWPQAQQAFFEAFRLDSRNAEYALNLAISLDQMGQYPTALDYYQKALTLANASNNTLDFAKIQKRIDVLATRLID